MLNGPNTVERMSSPASNEGARRKISAKPKQPSLNSASWSAWLRSYQRGDWDSSSDEADGDQDGSNPTNLPAPAIKSTNRKAQPCPGRDQAVKLTDGKKLSSLEFYQSAGWLAPPPTSRRLNKRRNLALRRHGITGPHDREALNLYIKHAMAVFKVDYASFMIAGLDDMDMLIVAQEGGKVGVQRVDRTITLCAHALLLSDQEVLVVNDTRLDWRFAACPATNEGTVCSQLGHALRFYASAPLCLSYSDDGIEGMVQTGRLCIMAREPREFSEADADLLMSIARMAGDALEKEHHIRRNAKAADVQRRSSYLIRALDMAKPMPSSKLAGNEDGSASSSAESAEGTFPYSTAVIEAACDEIRTCLGAAAVAAIDLSGLRIKNASQARSSPRNSAYPITPWQAPEETTSASPLTPPSDLGGASSPMVGPASPISPKTSRRHPVLRTKTSGADEVVPLVSGPPLQTLFLSGDQKYKPVLQGPAQLQAMCEWLGERLRVDKLECRAKVFRTSSEASTSDEDAELVDPPATRIHNPLQPILPLDVPIVQYAVAPGYDRQQDRPLLCFLVMFPDTVLLDEPEHLFIESCIQYSIGSIIRQKARDIDVIQAEFLRHVQHNLRTPLHGALGAVEYLQAFISGDHDGIHAPLDLRPDGVLATLLDSIALSGTTLNTYIDDLLSFQSLTGLTPGSRGLGRPVSTNLVKLVEAVCNEEWQLALRLKTQSQRVDPSAVGALSTKELIVKADPRVLAQEWMVDAKALGQAVRKVVSNAIKFTEDGYVEVTLRAAGPRQFSKSEAVAIEIEVGDTGVGMTREFCKDHLTKPFTKGDSFRDGIGLGMSIVSSTVQNMGGRLAVASEVGVGTRVTMTIPLSAAAQRFNRPSAPLEPPSLPLPPLSYAVKRIAFWGLETRGLRRLGNAICEYLRSRGDLELVEDPWKADALIVPDKEVYALDEDATTTSALLRPDVRLIIVQLLPTYENMDFESLRNRVVVPFVLPHGPSALQLLERFLCEEQPSILRDPRTRHHIGRSGSVDAPTLITSLDGYKPPRFAADAAERDDEDGKPLRQADDPGIVGSPVAVTPTNGSVSKYAAAPVSPRCRASEVCPEESPACPGESPAGLQGASDLGPAAKADRDEFRVLVVEDNPINMKLLTTLLKRLDIKHEEAYDGAEAVSKFASFRPALVLLDISLPIQDGFEACLQMRAHNHPSLIVAITALSSDEDRNRGIEVCGMDAWMMKPISPRLLKEDIVVWQKRWTDQAAGKADSSLPRRPSQE